MSPECPTPSLTVRNDRAPMTGTPEVNGSSVGLVPRNTPIATATRWQLPSLRDHSLYADLSLPIWQAFPVADHHPEPMRKNRWID